ncbi:4Fe-4S binding protein [Azoarcus communis]|mgnify:CR=1 FL=1|uniref:4Fe-4S binding protein n=1 Tax=Parazoarcus communis SWub3 = DSM 12120 TaxID=1121029 RepID=A0A323UVA5_9RHOO|nr:4Fe-4S binding protein [Parazoarcus communis]NMG50603.1 4Fe-4S binding protein [Parazoarcus communis]NMG70830.1 4Fe-4S binding protein [Parazoarcus communis SWub3 = DSM 12120]PZA16385.1 4Fe-4S binding protein [Azoarcus communis] [Parazoarcus communis SWub3 = DSM 12120]
MATVGAIRWWVRVVTTERPNPAPASTAPRRIIPIAVAENVKPHSLQQRRALCQVGFFVLFVLAPVFDILRYDLDAGHAWFLGFEWHLGLDDFLAGRIGALEAGTNVMLRLFLPLFAGAGAFIYIAWRWGRLYCGWLCPHFSVVETINRLMVRASGKPSIWEKAPITPWQPDGTRRTPDARWWGVVMPAAVAFAFTWAVVFLTYLLPPAEVYGKLISGELTRNQTLFIVAATTALSIEFLFARHLFCRYACAVGLFQSLAWMSNPKAMVVGFFRARARDCATCLPEKQSACDAVCPMRLTPRNIKRHMFTCTQCAQCIDACAETQRVNPNGPLLQWVQDEAARQNEAGFRAGREW